MNKRLAIALAVILTLSSGVQMGYAGANSTDDFSDFIQLMNEESEMPEFMTGEMTVPTDADVDDVIEAFSMTTRTS